MKREKLKRKEKEGTSKNALVGQREGKGVC